MPHHPPPFPQSACLKVGLEVGRDWFDTGSMSKTAPNQMTVRKVASLKDGVHGDGGNLWITVSGKSRTWSIRFKSPVTGKRREMGIGSAHDVSLANARVEAQAARKLLLAEVDPIEDRKLKRAADGQQAILTFAIVAEKYIEDRKAGWRSPKIAPAWTSSIKRWANPVFGHKPISSVSTEDVLAVIRPIWVTKTETAERVRARIERILHYARTSGWREGENPARWREHLSNILPPASAVSQVEHRAAVSWRAIASVMNALEKSTGMGALAVRFACLTAGRSGEVRGATWPEIDMKAKMWTISAERMKMKKEHRVPLSAPALEVLAKAQVTARGKDALVFTGGRIGRPLSDVALSKALHLAAGTKDVTVHGLRSTFRDWVSENTDFPRDVAEMALAHAIGDKVEAAYRRGDLLEKRTEMMGAWGQWCAGR